MGTLSQKGKKDLGACERRTFGLWLRHIVLALSPPLDGQALQQRNLAEIEYDWLAAVIERCFLMLFLTLFFFMCFGINGIGLYYWHYATVDS